jgi:ABC-type glycerol-3-phosphate transport system permease component
MLKLSPFSSMLGHGLLAVLSLSVLMPLFLVVAASFKPPHEIYGGLPWPVEPTTANYERVFNKLPFALYLWNSLATTLLRVAGQLIIAFFAAYALARAKFRGRGVMFALVLAAMMIPHQMVFLPLYLLISNLGWFDTWTALIVPNLAMPLAVFLLRQHLMSFPRELFDAASIDGAGDLQTIWYVVVPNLRPVLAALSIVLFVDCWNEYFWPLLVTESPRAMTAQIGIRRFMDAESGDEIGPLMAGVVLVSLPVLAAFVLFQKQIMQTFVSVGIK